VENARRFSLGMTGPQSKEENAMQKITPFLWSRPFAPFGSAQGRLHDTL
jgi:hypothetical protein